MINILLTDDEKIIREGAKMVIEKCVADANIVVCDKAAPALKAFEDTKFDIAFLDIEMPGTNGIELAKKIKKKSPNTNIIFSTAHPQYAVEAMNMHASGYITKPITKDKVLRELDNLRHPLENKSGLFVQAFGNFEIFYNGSPVKFKYNKSKELFAYLVDRNGATVTIGELRANLWEDDEDRTSYLKQLRKDIVDTLQSIDASDALNVVRGGMSVVPAKLKCDFFDYLAGDPNGIYAYHGEYMQQYSWAEVTHANLEMREA